MNPACAALRPELAETLMLGRPLTFVQRRHLAGCPGCAREADEIREVVATLDQAEGFPRSAGPAPGPVEAAGGLGPRIAADIRRKRVAGTRRRRALAVFAAAAAILGALVFTPVLGRGGPEPAHPVALAREGRMIPQPWGTEVPITLTGLDQGKTYRLMTADATGNTMPAGTVRAESDQPLHTHMVTAMNRAAIRLLIVADQDGRPVGQLPVA
ncbi:hypothetical protein FNH05_04825 [Amycolatopsis rhizosphaerae]|uniref:Zf-HC2 domain-containing protein n=1 Tax=Amycolatopsis rhizosphaerae TaxID=2053003 RepID=A0A558DGS9_9PSEU|nr:hypothetical protein [Amycolatopsis rhizosphaerae]TVT60231.1 hypothetical protein FNH05_04825 [Amycolatopsis rhizosphaerae]